MVQYVIYHSELLAAEKSLFLPAVYRRISCCTAVVFLADVYVVHFVVVSFVVNPHSHASSDPIVSDIAVFVLKRDGKLQLTNSSDPSGLSMMFALPMTMDRVCPCYEY